MNKKAFATVVFMIIALVLGILIFISFAPELSNTAAQGISGTTDGLTKFALASLPIIAFLVIIYLIMVGRPQ